MRFLFSIIGILLPQLLFAQFSFFNSCKPGSYVLASSPTIRHPAKLKLSGGNDKHLVIKESDGKKLNLDLKKFLPFIVDDTITLWQKIL